MRIIGGEFKGRVLKSPPKGGVRPIQDRVKGAIFNILQGKVEGADVLDLFSGSGSFGFEALSRGAAHVTFVEADRPLTQLIQQNLEKLGLENKATVLTGDVFESLGDLAAGEEMFDLIFSDPPYGQGVAESSLRQVAEYVILAQFGFMILSTHKRERLPERMKDLLLWRKRPYGGTVVWFYQR